MEFPHEAEVATNLDERTISYRWTVGTAPARVGDGADTVLATLDVSHHTASYRSGAYYTAALYRDTTNGQVIGRLFDGRNGERIAIEAAPRYNRGNFQRFADVAYATLLGLMTNDDPRVVPYFAVEPSKGYLTRG